jgi:hypothetical protein
MVNKQSFKKHYFKEWSNDMAYILGLFVSDGCVYIDKNKTYRSYICSKDMSVLEYVRDQIKPEGNINNSRDGTGRVWFINKDFVMDLMAHGIMPRKSWSPIVPDVPKEYVKSFLLGLFDGDGSVWINRSTMNLITSISSYSKQFLQIIGKMFKDEIGLIPKIYGNYSPSHSAYGLTYATKESLGMYHYFYDGNKNFYLQRKKDKFEEWLLNHKKDIDWGLCKCKICGTMFVKFHDKSSRCWTCRRNNHDIVRSCAKSQANKKTETQINNIVCPVEKSQENNTTIWKNSFNKAISREEHLDISRVTLPLETVRSAL